MPYITIENRIQLSPIINDVYSILNEYDKQHSLYWVFNFICYRISKDNLESGKINYIITCCILKLIEIHKGNYAFRQDIIDTLFDVRDSLKEFSGQQFKNIRGAILCACLEFYRRDFSKYEDDKIKENGDVYGENL